MVRVRVRVRIRVRVRVGVGVRVMLGLGSGCEGGVRVGVEPAGGHAPLRLLQVIVR